MGMYLARELQTYFRKSGNKYLFHNGMTLNEVAWEMQAVVQCGSIDPGILSKAINGRRLLSDWQVDAFCQALDLTESQRYELTFAIMQDRGVNAGLDIQLAMPPPAMTFIVRNMAQIWQATEQGELQRALDMLYNLYQWKCELEDVDAPAPVMRVFTLMNREREQLINAISKSPWSTEMNEIDIVALPSIAELVESIEAELSSDELNQLVSCAPTFSDIERRVWDQRYQKQLSVKQIAMSLQRTPATVESLLLTARLKALTYLQELNKES
ncbi:MAG: sigma-70 family RNA polymerase sigma factor [Caldilineaceae bacterium]|nr:sigma-70 family RNA polymerase sigma factor [Caldilineaceae bacterium]